MQVSNRIKAILAQYGIMDPAQGPKKHHIYIGAGGIVFILCISLVLLIPGKTKKLRADVPTVIEIESPVKTSASIAMPSLQSIGEFVSRDIPRSEVIEAPGVQIASYDGIPMEATGAGLFKRGSVALTKDLAGFAHSLSHYFSAHGMSAMITSGVRTSDHQLEIIKDRIAQCGMSRAFPSLEAATVSNKSSWTPAWEWLKSHHIPVNPPADYVNEDGNIVGGSLHLKGLAIDVVSTDLDALRDALVASANAGVSGGGLQITGLTRERDCVHISLSH